MLENVNGMTDIDLVKSTIGACNHSHVSMDELKNVQHDLGHHIDDVQTSIINIKNHMNKLETNHYKIESLQKQNQDL